jgi:hypothetical protein
MTVTGCTAGQGKQVGPPQTPPSVGHWPPPFRHGPPDAPLFETGISAAEGLRHRF